MNKYAEAVSLPVLAREVRRSSLRMVHAAKLGHPGGDLSAADILVALYFGVMRVDPERPRASDRDRFIMSKGHCSGALYSTLALRGFFPATELESYTQPLSRLNGHPNRNELPGVEANTGPLGHGLPIGVGAALAAQMDGAAWRTYVLTGDGELQEGMIWEALHIAPRYRLGNLTAILDWNGLQQFGWVLAINEEHRGDRRDPWTGIDLRGIFEKLGWRCIEIDGHDFAQIVPALEAAKASGESDQPTMIIAHTIKGKGVHFTEGKHEWHSKVATKDELRVVAKELGIEEAIA